MLNHCKTIEELKAEYRRLTKVYHPDCGGTDEQMKALNAEYERLFNILKDRHNATADEAHQTTETASEFIDILEALRNCHGIIIEQCGSWLWISGNTYPHREVLRTAKCRWSKSKSKWYWRHEEQNSGGHRKAMTMSWIRNRYGSETVTGFSPDPMLT